MKYKKKLLITDNIFLCEKFIDILDKKNIIHDFEFAYSSVNKDFRLSPKYYHINLIPINVKKQQELLIDNYDLIISLHCKQLFPITLVNQVKCINIHPGLNPYNRGWFPQVFSIINKLPLGATIHEIDEDLDHGNIISQQKVPVYSWDTSLSAYNRVLQAELVLIEQNIEAILNNTYQAKIPEMEGNLNYKKDFNSLCKLDLKEENTFEFFIDKLRALSHGNYNNAYFIDEFTGEKVFVKIHLEKDKK